MKKTKLKLEAMIMLRERKPKQRVLAMILTASLIFATVPAVFAEANGVVSLGECNHTHDSDCGFVEGTSCGYIHEHDIDCGYYEITADNCNHEHTHDSECGYDDGMGSDCSYTHTHDSDCGYVKAEPA